MYQLNPLADTSKLATLTAHWPITRAAQPNTAPRRHISLLRRALAELANVATLCRMPSSASGTARQHDPCDPQNW